MKVLVAGEGAVAAATVTALVEQGHEVRLLSPDAEAAVRRWPRGVEARVGDVASSRGAQGAAVGCQVVIHLGAVREPWATTARTGAGMRVSGPSRIDVRGTRWLVAEAERDGAERFVLLSSLRYERSRTEDGRALREAEDAARGFRGAWSILRAGLVYAPGEGALDSLATMIRTLPAIPVVDGGRPMLQPLWHEDLGRALARAAESADAAGRVLHVAGPERRRLSEVIDTLSELIGRRPVRLTIPSALATMGAEAATLLGIPLPARAGALAELDGDTLLPPSIENALTTVLGVTPTLVEDGLRRLVAGVPEQTPAGGSGTMPPAPRLGGHRRRRAHRARAARPVPPARVLRARARERAARGADDQEGHLAVVEGVPLRGLVSLRVAEVVPDSVTAQTVEGDPLAGLVTFRFRHQAPGIRAEIVVEADGGHARGPPAGQRRRRDSRGPGLGRRPRADRRAERGTRSGRRAARRPDPRPRSRRPRSASAPSGCAMRGTARRRHGRRRQERRHAVARRPPPDLRGRVPRASGRSSLTALPHRCRTAARPARPRTCAGPPWPACGPRPPTTRREVPDAHQVLRDVPEVFLRGHPVAAGRSATDRTGTE